MFKPRQIFAEKPGVKLLCALSMALGLALSHSGNQVCEGRDPAACATEVRNQYLASLTSFNQDAQPAWPPQSLARALVAGCVRHRDPFACYHFERLAERLAREGKLGSRIQSGPYFTAKELELLKSACQGGDSYSCVASASAHERGFVASRDARIAATLYRKSCELRNPIGCHMLSLQYRNGQGVRPSESSANYFKAKACEAGLTADCMFVERGVGAASPGWVGSTEEARAQWSSAVVQVRIEGFDEGTPISVRGTGFFVSPDGVLVTNYHVMEHVMEGKTVEAVFELSDGRMVREFLVGDCRPSTMTDLCVLKLEVEPRRHFKVSRALPAPGTPVFQIGHSTSAWVTRQGEYLGEYALRNAGYIEITGMTRSGDSGGPIFTADGQVIGVTTLGIYPYREPGTKWAENEGLRSVGMAGREVLRKRAGVRRFVSLSSYLSRR